MSSRRFVVRTFGCQMNEHDSERIAGLLEADGLVPASSEADADVVVIDPDVQWTVDPAEFKSKSSNTPFAGWKLTGRAEKVIVGGRLRFSR